MVLCLSSSYGTVYQRKQYYTSYSLENEEDTVQRSEFILFLGNRIRHFRKRERLSLLKLANMCEISEKHLGQIERGKGNASVELLEKLAGNLGIEIRELLDIQAEKDREELIKELQSILFQISDEDLRRIYRVVRACLE